MDSTGDPVWADPPFPTNDDVAAQVAAALGCAVGAGHELEGDAACCVCALPVTRHLGPPCAGASVASGWPACGHALCVDCAVNLHAPRCPLCRNERSSARVVFTLLGDADALRAAALPDAVRQCATARRDGSRAGTQCAELAVGALLRCAPVVDRCSDAALLELAGRDLPLLLHRQPLLGWGPQLPDVLAAVCVPGWARPEMLATPTVLDAYRAVVDRGLRVPARQATAWRRCPVPVSQFVCAQLVLAAAVVAQTDGWDALAPLLAAVRPSVPHLWGLWGLIARAPAPRPAARHRRTPAGVRARRRVLAGLLAGVGTADAPRFVDAALAPFVHRAPRRADPGARATLPASDWHLCAAALRTALRTELPPACLVRIARDAPGLARGTEDEEVGALWDACARAAVCAPEPSDAHTELAAFLVLWSSDRRPVALRHPPSARLTAAVLRLSGGTGLPWEARFSPPLCVEVAGPVPPEVRALFMRSPHPCVRWHPETVARIAHVSLVALTGPECWPEHRVPPDCHDGPLWHPSCAAAALRIALLHDASRVATLSLLAEPCAVVPVPFFDEVLHRPLVFDAAAALAHVVAVARHPEARPAVRPGTQLFAAALRLLFGASVFDTPASEPDDPPSLTWLLAQHAAARGAAPLADADAPPPLWLGTALGTETPLPVAWRALAGRSHAFVYAPRSSPVGAAFVLARLRGDEPRLAPALQFLAARLPAALVVEHAAASPCSAEVGFGAIVRLRRNEAPRPGAVSVLAHRAAAGRGVPRAIAVACFAVLAERAATTGCAGARECAAAAVVAARSAGVGTSRAANDAVAGCASPGGLVAVLEALCGPGHAPCRCLRVDFAAVWPHLLAAAVPLVTRASHRDPFADTAHDTGRGGSAVAWWFSRGVPANAGAAPADALFVSLALFDGSAKAERGLGLAALRWAADGAGPDADAAALCALCALRLLPRLRRREEVWRAAAMWLLRPRPVPSVVATLALVMTGGARCRRAAAPLPRGEAGRLRRSFRQITSGMLPGDFVHDGGAADLDRLLRGLAAGKEGGGGPVLRAFRVGVFRAAVRALRVPNMLNAAAPLDGPRPCPHLPLRELARWAVDQTAVRRRQRRGTKQEGAVPP